MNLRRIVIFGDLLFDWLLFEAVFVCGMHVDRSETLYQVPLRLLNIHKRVLLPNLGFLFVRARIRATCSIHDGLDPLPLLLCFFV